MLERAAPSDSRSRKAIKQTCSIEWDGREVRIMTGFAMSKLLG